MSIGSISSGAVSTDAARLAADARAAQAEAGAERRSIADHVAAADEHEPIRAVSATQGTIVDTYL